MTLENISGGGVIVEDTGPAGDPAGGGFVDWTTVAPLGTGRQSLAATVDNNGLLYAIGGNSSANNYESVVEQYDPSTDTWTTVASLGTARQFLAATVDNNGLLYAIGGASSTNTYESVVEQYDPSTDTWTTVASLGTARRELAATVDNNGLLYAIGGASSANTYESVVEQSDFNPSYATTYSATGDTLFAADDPNAQLKNESTGRIVTGDSLIARNGEAIAWFSEEQARLYRTEET